MRAGWFGVYNANSYPWVFHPNLGWVYVTENRKLVHGCKDRTNMEWLWTKTATLSIHVCCEKAGMDILGHSTV